MSDENHRTAINLVVAALGLMFSITCGIILLIRLDARLSACEKAIHDNMIYCRSHQPGADTNFWINASRSIYSLELEPAAPVLVK